MLVYLVHVVPTVWLQYPGGFMFHVPSVQSIRMAQDCIQRHIEKMAAAWLGWPWICRAKAWFGLVGTWFHLIGL